MIHLHIFYLFKIYKILGIDYYCKKIDYEKTCIKLNLWDSSGSEYKDKIIPKTLCKTFHAVIICIAYDDLNSFYTLENWIKYAKTICPNIDSFPKFIPIIIALNKFDKSTSQYDAHDLETYLNKIFDRENFYICSKISAKEEYGINLIFDKILEIVLPGLGRNRNTISGASSTIQKKNSKNHAVVTSTITKMITQAGFFDEKEEFLSYEIDENRTTKRNTNASIYPNEEVKNNNTYIFQSLETPINKDCFVDTSKLKYISYLNSSQSYFINNQKDKSVNTSVMRCCEITKNTDMIEDGFFRSSIINHSKITYKTNYFDNSNTNIDVAKHLKQLEQSKNYKSAHSRKVSHDVNNHKNIDKKIKYNTKFKKFIFVGESLSKENLYDNLNKPGSNNFHRNSIKNIKEKSFSLVPGNKKYGSFRDNEAVSRCCK